MAPRNLDPTIGAEAVVASLDRLFRLLRRVHPDDPLSLTAASTLRRLAEDGTHRLTELSGLEGVTQPAMTQLVSRLEKDGLVDRVRDRADGRVCLVAITDAGRDMLHQRRAERARRLHDLLAALDPADRDAILAALPALDKLNQEGLATS